jgi:predicted acyltransferase
MNKRNLAIDILRGLTMALMVMVNDFWSYPDVPHFLEHYATLEDGMGLSDFIFPMFLFVMGMSIPYALDRRLEKGKTDWDNLGHVLSRTFALLVMGVFLYNTEPPMAWHKGIYYVLMIVGFFLVWNSYKESFKPAKWLKLAGALILIGLVVCYRTEDGELFRTGWWGILGQIGWAYLFASLAYMLCRRKEWLLAVLWGALCLMNLSVVQMRSGSPLIGHNVAYDLARAIHLDSGHIGIMALGGVLTVLAERKLRARKALAGFAMAAVLALMAFAAHQGWIISKNLGTLPWCLYASATSVALYTLFRILEKHSLTGWARPLAPAGTATLTVYMLPYLYTSLWYFFDMTPPAWLYGWVGVGKSVLLSAVCIFLTWCLGKVGIKLKI